MRIDIVHCTTPDAIKARGDYDHDLLRFTDGNVTLVARSYTSIPLEASFLGIEMGGSPTFITRADFDRPLFREAAAHLRTLGKTSLLWLNVETGGYEAVP
jgi:hypothetical protein